MVLHKCGQAKSAEQYDALAAVVFEGGVYVHEIESVFSLRLVMTKSDGVMATMHP